MKGIKKIRCIITSGSGVSLIFVLCAMLMLIAIGTSTLVAASTASGVSTNKRNAYRAETLSDSVINSFTQMINIRETVPENGLNEILARKIVREYLEYEKAAIKPDPKRDMSFNIASGNITGFPSGGINGTITYNLRNGVVKEYYTDNTSITDGLYSVAIPSELRLSITISLEYPVVVGGKTLNAYATYACNGVTAKLDNKKLTEATDTELNNDVKYTIGEWRLVGYERIEDLGSST